MSARKGRIGDQFLLHKELHKFSKCPIVPEVALEPLMTIKSLDC